MAGSYNTVNARCPYYVYDDPQRKAVTCEGILPGAYTTHKFSKRAELDAQLRIFCNDHFEKCEYCLAMDGYWKDE